MKFDLDYLRQSLEPLGQATSYVIGLSGGMDSIVLLYAMSRVVEENPGQLSLRAIHVNHGLQAEADRWQRFCESFCTKLGVPLSCEKVQIGNDNPQESAIEKLAREARYQVFESKLQQQEVILLAHHLDDQLETLLFRLNRGASVKGLSAIPQRRELGKGEIFRPLLEVGRSKLQEFAEENQLEWIEDNSNQDVSFDRNFLRQELLPVLESRWPNYRSSWSKSLQLISEANEMLEELAAVDLAALQVDNGAVISIDGLCKLSLARQRNVIRFWIERLGLSDPGWQFLQQLVNEFVPVATEAEGLLPASGYSLGRYRNHLYLVREQSSPPESLNWIPQEVSVLEIAGCGKLIAQDVIGQGLAKSQTDSFHVRFRQGGETCRLQGRPSKSLKKLLQEAHIEPWWRERIPLIYRDNELVCIPGIGIAEGLAAAPDEPGIELQWQRSPADTF